MSSAQQIQSDMRELKEITSELKRMKMTCRILTHKKKEIEDRIKEYLSKHEQPGLKYQSMVVLQTEKKIRKRKSVEERATEVAEILQEKGMMNGLDEAVNEIMETLKGRAQTTTALKVKEEAPDRFRF